LGGPKKPSSRQDTMGVSIDKTREELRVGVFQEIRDSNWGGIGGNKSRPSKIRP